MVRYISLPDLYANAPEYEQHPNIHVSGSLIGMRDLYGWDLKYVVKSGTYYYYLKHYPEAVEYINTLE